MWRLGQSKRGFGLPFPGRCESDRPREFSRYRCEIFDRTFQITEVLRILAALVAFLGVLSALLSIELERAHELAVLRSLGFSPRELTMTLLSADRPARRDGRPRGRANRDRIGDLAGARDQSTSVRRGAWTS